MRFDGSFPSQSQWQPYIDTATDTQSHEPLESDADRYPFLLLDSTPPAPPSDDQFPRPPRHDVELAAWVVRVGGIIWSATSLPPPPDQFPRPPRHDAEIAAWVLVVGQTLTKAVQITSHVEEGDAQPPTSSVDQPAVHRAWLSDPQPQQRRRPYTPEGEVVVVVNPPPSNVDQVAAARAWEVRVGGVLWTAVGVQIEGPAPALPPHRDAQDQIARSWQPEPRPLQPRPRYIPETVVAAAVVPFTRPPSTAAWLADTPPQQRPPRFPGSPTGAPKPRDVQSQIAASWFADPAPTQRRTTHTAEPKGHPRPVDPQLHALIAQAWEPYAAQQRRRLYPQGLDDPPRRSLVTLLTAIFAWPSSYPLPILPIRSAWLKTPQVDQPQPATPRWLASVVESWQQPAPTQPQRAPKSPIPTTEVPRVVKGRQERIAEAWNVVTGVQQRAPMYAHAYTPDAPPPQTRQPDAIHSAWRVEPPAAQRRAVYPTTPVLVAGDLVLHRNAQPAWPVEPPLPTLPRHLVPSDAPPPPLSRRALASIVAAWDVTSAPQTPRRAVRPVAADAPPVARRGDLGPVSAWYAAVSAQQRRLGYAALIAPAVVNNPPFARQRVQLDVVITGWWKPEPPRKMAAPKTPQGSGSTGAMLRARSTPMVDTGARDARSAPMTSTGPRKARSVRRI